VNENSSAKKKTKIAEVLWREVGGGGMGVEGKK